MKKLLLVSLFTLILFLSSCTPKEYLISYDTNGGSLIEEYTYIEDEEYTVPNDPIKVGYEFLGWFTDSELTESFNIENEIETDLILYAKWGIYVFDVTYILNNGEEDRVLPTEYGSIATILMDVEREGYDFEGWYTDPEFTNPYNFYTNIGVTEDQTIYANWIINSYNVSFYINDYLVFPMSVVDFGSTIEIPELPVLNGYQFKGWYTDEEFTELYDFDTNVNSSTVLYGKFEIEVFTISFETFGGTVIEPIDVEFGSTIPIPDVPIKEGYNFRGWYLDAMFLNPAGLSPVVVGNQTLYAKWIDENEITLRVVFVPSRPASEILNITGPLEQLLIDALVLSGYTISTVDISVSSSYEAAAESIISGQADIVFLPAGIYVEAKDAVDSNVDVLLSSARLALNKDYIDASLWNDGTPTVSSQDVYHSYYRGLIVAGPSAAGKALADKVNAGTTLVWEDVKDLNWCVRNETSSSGYVYPNLWLYETFGKTFADMTSVTQSSGYGHSIEMLASEVCDVATIYADARMHNEDQWQTNFSRTEDIWTEVEVIAVTHKIMNDVIAVNTNNLTPELISSLKQAFLDIIATPEGQDVFSVYSIQNFVEVEDSDYDGVRAATLLANN